MKDNASRFPIRLMARALKVSAAGYYAWRTRPESSRARRNRALLTEIRAIHAESRRTYAAPASSTNCAAAGTASARSAWRA